MTIKRLLIVTAILIFTLSACKKDPILIDNNYPPQGNYVSTEQLKNYINRLYIDLLGRAPLEDELTRDMEEMKADSLSENVRLSIIRRLQSDTSYHDGDTSYQKAYYQRLYSMIKQRLLEGVEDDYFYEFGIGVFAADLAAAESAGDSIHAIKVREDIQECYDVLNLKNEWRRGEIDIAEVHRRCLDNFVYETINMNTFNFVNASFDNMYYRFPTLAEYTTGYNMVEYNQSGYLLGMNGASRGDYIYIVTHSREFTQGIIVWMYKALLLRNPNDDELDALMQQMPANIEIEQIQQAIMKTDEYANF